jgi:hypothetical protein
MGFFSSFTLRPEQRSSYRPKSSSTRAMVDLPFLNPRPPTLKRNYALRIMHLRRYTKNIQKLSQLNCNGSIFSRRFGAQEMKMSDTNRINLLKLTLRIVGVIFIAGIYSLMMM